MSIATARDDRAECPSEEARVRLERLVAERVPCGRREAQALIRRGRVRLDGIVERSPAERTLARRRASADAGTNIATRRGAVTPAQRAERLGQKPFTMWFTGLPRSGKTGLAYGLEQALFERGIFCRVLDGENLRGGLSDDLGFAADDRWEHQRRAAQVARMDNEHGIVTLVALVSPLDADREQAKRIVGPESFLEVYCDAPLDVVEKRDDRELYARARRGEIEGLTGVDGPYEPPLSPFLRLDTADKSVEENVATLLDALTERGLIG